MITRDQIVDQARTWLGTPWHHQARLKGVGVDCIGLISGVCKELGMPVQDYTNYDRLPDGVTLTKELEGQLVRKDGPPEPGDVLLFRITKMPQHVAICTDLGLIHAHLGSKTVVETVFSAQLRNRLIAVYSIPGVI